MGGVSALIVSPCVAAPLAGALALPQPDARRLARRHRAVLARRRHERAAAAGRRVGRRAAAARRRLDGRGQAPRSACCCSASRCGRVQPVLPGPLALALLGRCSLLGAAGAARHARARSRRRASAARRRRAGLAPGHRRAARAGRRAQLVGAASGGDRSARSRSRTSRRAAASTPRRACRASQRVRSVAELDAALRTAGRPVMLDFYADWCVSCKEMERFTFTDPAVQSEARPARCC